MSEQRLPDSWPFQDAATDQRECVAHGSRGHILKTTSRKRNAGRASPQAKVEGSTPSALSPILDDVQDAPY